SAHHRGRGRAPARHWWLRRPRFSGAVSKPRSLDPDPGLRRLRVGWLSVSEDVEGWQGADDVDSFDADAGDALDEVDDVAGVVVFAAPVVRVVDDAAGLVSFDLVPLEYPVEGAARAEHVLVRLLGDAPQFEALVDDDAGLVPLGRFAAVLHL